MGMLEGAAIALAFLLIGRFLPGRRRHRVKKVQPACGCGHHYSFHEPDNGACHATEELRTGTDKRGYGLYEQVTCQCRQYSGPQPLPEYFAGEIQ